MKTSVAFTAPLLLTMAVSSTVSYAYDQGDLLVRAGYTQVSPDDSSSNVRVDGADIGVGVSVDDNAQLGLNVVYFYSPKVAVELLAATPFSHDVTLDTVGKLAEVKHLPPTFSVNYYLSDPSSSVQPYLGAGVNYTAFFDEELESSFKAQGFRDLSLDDSFGLAAQAGVDFVVNDSWHVNASARWIDIDTTAEFRVGDAKGKVDVEIDPWVYTVSVGYKF